MNSLIMKKNKSSRRKFIKNLAWLSTGVSITTNKLWGIPNYLPNRSLIKKTINGVQLGLITYSFRALKDQSAEATLQYILDCGINSIELMGKTAESFVGLPETSFDRGILNRLLRKERKNILSKVEEKELVELKKQQKSYDKEVNDWKKKRSIDRFNDLRKMYNSAGVDIYAFKPNYLLRKGNSDADINYAMQAGKILGASHVTLELPEDINHSLRLGRLAEKNRIKVAYHGHEQQHAHWWDIALKQSSHNAMNLDLGHYIAAGNTDAIELIKNQHPNILSMHVKDRQNPKNGKKNMPFGQGDTPIKEVLKMMRDNSYKFSATVEYEYQTPKESSIIAEIKKSIEYCKNVLES
tara:strand:+ start:3990 stop:5048 length:1059 start_codon:yes stop_codon:yes gene_type:complete